MVQNLDVFEIKFESNFGGTMKLYLGTRRSQFDKSLNYSYV